MDLQYRQIRPAPDQSGAYTLATVLFLLLILGLSSVFATQISVNEQRIANNAFHILQAKQNAQIVLSDISSKLRWIEAKKLNTGGKKEYSYPELATSSGKTQGSGIVELVRLGETNFLLKITAKSSANTARYTLNQAITFHKLFHSLPQQAIITSDDISLSNTNEIKRIGETNASPLAWSGGSITSNLNTTEKVENDIRLTTMSRQEIIKNFLRLDHKTLKTYSKNISCKIVQCSSSDIANASIAYIDGDISIEQDLGSSASPIILIVDGQFNLEKNATINGLVFLLEGWKGSLQAGSIHGSIIVKGGVDIEGVVSIQYDPTVLASLDQNTGFFSPVAGAWRDF